MSDILIKNMKMPENCLHCGFSHMASDCLKIWIICKPKDISVTDGDAVKDGRPDWCPLIEVPTPHGRLIDADALTALWAKDIDTLDEYLSMPLLNDKDRQMWLDSKRIRQNLINFLSLLPTIIGAEGE